MFFYCRNHTIAHSYKIGVINLWLLSFPPAEIVHAHFKRHFVLRIIRLVNVLGPIGRYRRRKNISIYLKGQQLMAQKLTHLMDNLCYWWDKMYLTHRNEILYSAILDSTCERNILHHFISARAWRYKRYSRIKTGIAIHQWMAIPGFIPG